MANPLRELPRGILQTVREYASDRVQPHPTAPLIKNLLFNRDHDFLHVGPNGRLPLIFPDGIPSLYVGGDLTKRVHKCSSAACWLCSIHNSSCANARPVTRPVTCRRYILSDFMEPDRYVMDSLYHSGFKVGFVQGCD